MAQAPTVSRLDSAAIDELASALRGQLIRPSDDDYDTARAMWNAMIDRRPALIARCTGVADIRMALAFAREHDLPVTVRGAGHSVAGRSTSDGGLMIDLGSMRWVQVDPESRTVRLGPGVVGADLDHETQAFGLATTVGTDSTTGVIGLTLGGGAGFVGRRFGLAIDNMIGADVVLPDGRLVHASATQHPDLFWALRGGGGELGVVTSVELRLHEMGPELFVAQLFHPYEAAADALRFYRDFTANAPDELACYALAVNVPPVDPFPEAYHGRTAIALVASHSGPIAEGEAALKPLVDFGEPMLRVAMPMPYVALQQSFDAGFPSGRRYFWKSQYLDRLSDEAIETFLAHADPLPGAYSAAFFEPLGGAIGRPDPTATAFPHRAAAYNFAATAGWDDPQQDELAVGWARAFHDAMAPFGTGGTYANYVGLDDLDRRRAVHGANLDRLTDVKARYDPAGVLGARRR
jgi:FAD/FMN-containing dehydrogenase